MLTATLKLLKRIQLCIAFLLQLVLKMLLKSSCLLKLKSSSCKLQLFIKILNSFGGDEICQIQSLSLMKIK